MAENKHLKTDAAKIQSVEFKCHAPEAQQVFVAGTFNEWQPDATLLVRDQCGGLRPQAQCASPAETT